MKFIKKSYLWAFICMSVGFANAQQKIKIDGVAAVIGDKIVLESDVDKYKKEIESRSDGEIDLTSCDIMEDIMKQKLLAHKAVVDSVLVSDAEVNAGVQRTLDHFKKQVGGDMNKVVSLYGFDDLDDLTKELTRIERENTLIKRKRDDVVKDVAVTPEEIRFFYNDLKKEDNLPTFGVEVELSQIAIKANPTKEAVKEVVDKLNEIKKDVEENGYNLRLKAILFSEDPSVAQNGGLFTISRESGFVKEFKETAFSLEEGEISDPFKTQFGYHILQVEKIKGLQRDVRHVLIQPKIEDIKLKLAKEKIASVRTEIISGEITFEEAVRKYSDDFDTNLNKGKLVNKSTGDAKFELNKMPPEMFSKIDKLQQGDITEPFFEENREGEKMYKMIRVVKREDTHKADLAKDYVKIQGLALRKKEQETLDKWYNENMKDSYIKLNEEYAKCNFKYNWKN